MAAREVLALNTSVPRIEAAQSGDTYTFPRAADFPLGTAADPAVAFTGDANTGIFSPTADTVAVTTGGVERLRVNSSGNLALGQTTAASGGSSARWLTVGTPSASTYSGGIAFAINGTTQVYTYQDDDNLFVSQGIGSNAGFKWVVGGSDRLRLNASGNLGLGVTPSAWGSGQRALQMPAGAIWNFNSSNMTIAANTYSDGTEKYVNTGYASTYNQNSGQHIWRTAASGTADTAITFTTVMTLNASGNLGIGTTSPGTTLEISKGGGSAPNLSGTSGNFAITQPDLLTSLQFGGYSTAPYALWIQGQNKTGTAFPIALNPAGGNVGIGTTSFGTSAARVLSIGSGTEPTTGPADTIQIYSVDRSAGNTIPAIYCEGTGVTDAAITNTTVTNKIAIKVNGTVYYLLATTSAS